MKLLYILKKRSSLLSLEKAGGGINPLLEPNIIRGAFLRFRALLPPFDSSSLTLLDQSDLWSKVLFDRLLTPIFLM